MPIIDLSFVLMGKTVPLDHGYNLFSALCGIVPELHGDRGVGVQPIRGRQSAPGVLSLLNQSRLRIRLHSEQIAPYIAVAGKVLDLEGHHLRVGIPQVEPLKPVANLGARLVTFRRAMDPAAFEADVRRELERMRIAATPHFLPATRPKFEGQPNAPRDEGQGSKDRRLRPASLRTDCGGIDPVARRGPWRSEADGMWGVQPDDVSVEARRDAASLSQNGIPS